MYGGTLRDGNSTGAGGGVNVRAGTMNMYGGTITENTATTDGGGIYVGTKGTLNLYGGTITKNTVKTNEAHHGGGVYVESNFETGIGKISISGSPVITGNTRVYTDASTGAQTTSTENLYLSYGFYNSGKFPTITLGTLTGGARIGISTGLYVFSTESKTNYSEYFISDDARRHVEYNADKKLELVEGAAHVHSGGTATCTNAAVYYKSCTVCGLSSKGMDGEATFTSGNILGHDWGAWTSNGDGTHTRTCKRDTSHTETESCTGGTADCTNKAICTVCGGEYGDLASHNFTAETVGGKYLKSAADCEHAAVYAGWSVRELPFTDVGRGDWFFDDVRYVYETGLMNGVTATRFAPYASTTRGMIVTILYRMEGQPAVSRDCPFTDVASGSYYERAITWAAANGIVTGHSSTIFAPDANITREQLAAILYRYAFYKGLDVSVGENTNILSYEDFASLSEYAIPAMQWACGAGILYGFGGSLLPDAPANRLQAAAILHRFCVNILN